MACYGYRVLVREQPLHGSLALAAQGHLGCRPYAETGFLGWWAIANGRAPVYPPMPTMGLFRIVRQPIYVAFTLTLWTVPTWTPDQLAIALFLTTYCLVGPLLKEKRFRRRFGQSFMVYEIAFPTGCRGHAR